MVCFFLSAEPSFLKPYIGNLIMYHVCAFRFVGSGVYRWRCSSGGERVCSVGPGAGVC